jgi:hypothetical protein
MVAFWSLGTAAVVALKLTDIAPATTVIDAGTVSVAFVFVKATVAPPAGAAFVSVTVHALEAFGPRLFGVQVSDDTSTGATSPIVWLAELLL